MENSQKLIASTLIAAFTLSACAESDFDKNRKPALIEQVVDLTKKTCDMRDPAQRDSDYETRLRTVLKGTESTALDVFIKNDIAICLDSRLQQQRLGFWDTRIYGIYYNHNQPVVTLWDNGIVDEGESLWHTDTIDYGADVLEKFVDRYKDGDITARDEFAFAGRYSCGKCTTTKWKTQENFSRGAQEKNQHLFTAPLAENH